MTTFELNANLKGACTSNVDVSGCTVITAYISQKSGKDKVYRVFLDISPDGENWFDVGEPLHETGFVSVQTVAKYARVCVAEVEGEISTLSVTILAG